MKNYFGYTEKDFIGNISNPTFLQWMKSKGTSYQCYLECMEGYSDISYYNRKIEQVRVVVNAIQAPLNFLFFYWTLIVFILHKFNFKKPVMKLLLGHLILRCCGNILEELGNLFPNYYSYHQNGDNKNEYHCECNGGSSTLNPFRWILTRFLGTFCWYTGEIIADWYPLIRTKAIVKNKSIWIVYITCALFNLTKIFLIIFHFSMDPTKLYDLSTGRFKKQIIDNFYINYWVVQLIIIYASVLYELSVYIVLKKNFFKVTKYDNGFFKNFKSLSEYRILVTAIITAIFLPIASIALFLKLYFIIVKNKNLEFEFETLRLSIANLQYYMIFIDQILLITSNYESILANFDIFNCFDSHTSNTSNKKSSSRQSKNIIEEKYIPSPEKNSTNFNSRNSLDNDNSFIVNTINNNNNFQRNSIDKENSFMISTINNSFQRNSIDKDNSFMISTINNNLQINSIDKDNSFIENTSMTAINSINSEVNQFPYQNNNSSININFKPRSSLPNDRLLPTIEDEDLLNNDIDRKSVV